MSGDSNKIEVDKVHQDLWNYLSQITEEEKENWKIESFSHLRNLLTKEMEILLDLYKPIESLVKENLKSDNKNKGPYLYNEWGKSGKKEFMTSYYENEYFRAVYARNRFLNSATSFVQTLILRVIPDSPQIEAFLTEEVRRVVSIGVGPGSDIAGFLAFLQSRGVNRQIVYFTMDQCTHWSEYVLEMDRAWCHKYKTSIWFKQCRFGHRSSLESLPDADMIVFSFANTINMDINIWPELAKRYRFVLILDGIKDAMLSSIEMSNYTKFRLNEKNFIYFSFKESQSDTIPAAIVDEFSVLNIDNAKTNEPTETSTE